MTAYNRLNNSALLITATDCFSCRQFKNKLHVSFVEVPKVLKIGIWWLVRMTGIEAGT